MAQEWTNILTHHLQLENLPSGAAGKGAAALLTAVGAGDVAEQKLTALLLKACQETFQAMKDAPEDVSLLRTCTVLATALASHADLPPKTISSALKLQGFYVACASRTLSLSTLKSFTRIARWLMSLPDDQCTDGEAYAKLSLHLLASIPAFFKANQSVTADAVKLTAAWAQGIVPDIVRRLSRMNLADGLARHLESTLQSLLATVCTLAVSAPQLCGALSALIGSLAQTKLLCFSRTLTIVRRYASSPELLPQCFHLLCSDNRDAWTEDDVACLGMLVLAEDVARLDSSQELAIWNDVRSFEFQSRINQMLALALAELVSGPQTKAARRRQPWELLCSNDLSAWVTSLAGTSEPPQAELITKIIVCCTEQLLTTAHRPQPKTPSTKRAQSDKRPVHAKPPQSQHLHSMMSFALRLLETITGTKNVSLQGVCDRCVRQVMRAVTIVAECPLEADEPSGDVHKVLENLTSMCFALFPAINDSLYQTLSRCVQTNLHHLYRVGGNLSSDFMARLLAVQTTAGIARVPADFVAMLSAIARLLPAEAACSMLLATLSTQQLDDSCEYAVIAQLMAAMIKGLCDGALTVDRGSLMLLATIKQAPSDRKQRLLIGLCKAISQNCVNLVKADAPLRAVDHLLGGLEAEFDDPVGQLIALYCRAHLVWAFQAVRNVGDETQQLSKMHQDVHERINRPVRRSSKMNTKKPTKKSSKQRSATTEPETSVPQPLVQLVEFLLRRQWQLQQEYYQSVSGGGEMGVGSSDTDGLLTDSTSESTSDEESDEERSHPQDFSQNEKFTLPQLLLFMQELTCNSGFSDMLNHLMPLVVQLGFVCSAREFEELRDYLDDTTAENEALLLWGLLHIDGVLPTMAPAWVSEGLVRLYRQLIDNAAAPGDDYERCLTVLAGVQSRDRSTAHELVDMIKFLAAAKLALAAGDFTSTARFGRYVVLCTNSPFDKMYGGRLSLAKLAVRTEALLVMAEMWDCIGTPDSAMAYLTQADKLATAIFAASRERLSSFGTKSARLWHRIGQPRRVVAGLGGDLHDSLLTTQSSLKVSRLRDHNPQSLEYIISSATLEMMSSLEELPSVIFGGMEYAGQVNLPELPMDVLRHELSRCPFDHFRDACRMLATRYLLDPNVSAESTWRCAAASINPSAAGQLFRRSGVLDAHGVPTILPSSGQSGMTSFWDATLFMPDSGSHLDEVKQMLLELKAGPEGVDASTTLVCNLGSEVLLVGRLSAEGPPLTVALQCAKQFASVLEQWQELMERNKEQLHGTRDAQTLRQWTTQSKEAWWAGRHKLDDDVSECLDKLQALLGPWRCLLSPQDRLPDAKSTKRLEDLVTQIANELRGGSRKGSSDDMLSEWITALLLAFPMLSEEEVLTGLRQIMGFRTNREEIPPQAVELVQEAIEVVESCNDFFSLGNQLMSASDGSFETGSDEEADWSTMTVTQLREHLKAANLPTAGRKAELIARLEEHHAPQKPSDTSASAPNSKDKCSILMLDEQLQSICLEAMPTMRRVAAFRMPGLSLLEELLSRRHAARTLSVERAWYVVDPENNLPNTRKTMSEFIGPYASKWNWTGFVAEAPPKEVVQELHEQSEAFIYCGHGAGERLCQRQKLERFNSCPAAFLWGCSSGRLQQKGIHDPTGAAISYLLAGAPLVIGNLWDVTDRDIDRVSMECMRQLFDGADGSAAPHQVPKALVNARDACKLYYAVGCAAVCYGLPVPIAPPK